MSANRADFRSFFSFNNVAAIGADPNGLFIAFEHGPIFYLFQQSLVSFFMMFFDSAYSSEFISQFGEAFFFSGFSEAFVHIGPFVMFTGSRIFQVGNGIRNGAAMESLEPNLSVFFFVVGGFQEVGCYSFIAFFFSYGSIITILVIRLRFTCKSSL